MPTVSKIKEHCRICHTRFRTVLSNLPALPTFICHDCRDTALVMGLNYVDSK